MKINLYVESPAAGPGGGEQCLAVLAEALSDTHEVRIVHHKPPEAVTLMAEFTGCDLSRVGFCYVEPEEDRSVSRSNPWSRFRAARAWRRQLSEDCDLFIAFLHNKPPFCHAGTGIILVLFPTFKPFGKTKQPVPNRRLPFSHAYAKWEWRRRLKSYRTRLAISDFTRGWVKRRWKIDSEVVYPPAETGFDPAVVKENVILSSGRFATRGNTKKQTEMLATFRGMKAELPGWKYRCVGGVSDLPQDRDFFARLQREASLGSIEILANVDRAHLKHYYESAKIFWHAAGYGEDEERRPENTEHFGITTAEAMAAGCVPVVARKGGQPEIVEHRVTGFVWDSLDELKDYTQLLARDDALRSSLSQAARKRAARYGRETFVENFRRLVAGA